MAKIGIEKFIQKALGIRPKRSSLRTGKKFNAFVYAENYAYIMADRRRAQLQEYKLKSYAESLYRANRKRIAYSEDAKDSFGKKILETGKKAAINVWQFIKRLAQAFVNMFKQLIIKLTNKTEKYKKILKDIKSQMNKYKSKKGFVLKYKVVISKENEDKMTSAADIAIGTTKNDVENSGFAKALSTVSGSKDIKINILSGRAANANKVKSFLDALAKLNSSDLETLQNKYDEAYSNLQNSINTSEIVSLSDTQSGQDNTIYFEAIDDVQKLAVGGSKMVNEMKLMVINMSQLKNASVSVTEKYSNDQLSTIRENIALVTSVLNLIVKIANSYIDELVRIAKQSVEVYEKSADEIKETTNDQQQ